MRFFAWLAIVMFLCAIVYADETALPDNSGDWTAEQVQNNLQAAFDKDPARAAELAPAQVFEDAGRTTKCLTVPGCVGSAESYFTQPGNLKGDSGKEYLSYKSGHNVAFDGDFSAVSISGVQISNVKGFPIEDIGKFPSGTKIRPNGDSGFVIVTPDGKSTSIGSGSQETDKISFKDGKLWVGEKSFSGVDSVEKKDGNYVIKQGKLEIVASDAPFDFSNGVFIPKKPMVVSFDIGDGQFRNTKFLDAKDASILFKDDSYRISGNFLHTFTYKDLAISVPNALEFAAKKSAGAFVDEERKQLIFCYKCSENSPFTNAVAFNDGVFNFQNKVSLGIQKGSSILALAGVQGVDNRKGMQYTLDVNDFSKPVLSVVSAFDGVRAREIAIQNYQKARDDYWNNDLAQAKKDFEAAKAAYSNNEDDAGLKLQLDIAKARLDDKQAFFDKLVNGGNPDTNLLYIVRVEGDKVVAGSYGYSYNTWDAKKWNPVLKLNSASFGDVSGTFRMTVNGIYGETWTATTNFVSVVKGLGNPKDYGPTVNYDTMSKFNLDNKDGTYVISSDVTLQGFVKRQNTALNFGEATAEIKNPFSAEIGQDHLVVTLDVDPSKISGPGVTTGSLQDEIAGAVDLKGFLLANPEQLREPLSKLEFLPPDVIDSIVSRTKQIDKQKILSMDQITGISIGAMKNGDNVDFTFMLRSPGKSFEVVSRQSVPVADITSSLKGQDLFSAAYNAAGLFSDKQKDLVQKEKLFESTIGKEVAVK